MARIELEHRLAFRHLLAAGFQQLAHLQAQVARLMARMAGESVSGARRAYLPRTCSAQNIRKNLRHSARNFASAT